MANLKYNKAWMGFIYTTAGSLCLYSIFLFWGAAAHLRALDAAEPHFPLATVRQSMYLEAGMNLIFSTYLMAANPVRMDLNFRLIFAYSAVILLLKSLMTILGIPDFFSCLGNLRNPFFTPPNLLNLFIYLYLGCLAVVSFFGLLPGMGLLDKRKKISALKGIF